VKERRVNKDKKKEAEPSINKVARFVFYYYVAKHRIPYKMLVENDIC